LGGGGTTGLEGWASSEAIEISETTRKKSAGRIKGAHFRTHRAALVISTSAAGEESSAIRAIAVRAVK
jgi:hypothetical protein